MIAAALFQPAAGDAQRALRLPSMPVDHYENFPVASIFLPSRLRPAVEAIYAFARSADDIADEGNAGAAERLAELARYQEELDRIERGLPSQSPLFQRLADVIASYGMPLQPFRDLLSAFSQDVVQSRYENLDELLDYCRRSANPVGRIMLCLYRAENEINVQDSDRICTALQLINFWQDVGVDAQKGRIYAPLDALQRHGVCEVALLAGQADDAFRALLQEQVAQARDMLERGAPLALRLPGRIGMELRMVVQGGLRILESIEAVNFDVFRRRPSLRAADWLRIGWRALAMRAAH